MVPIVFVHEHEHVHENDKALKADRLKAVVLTLNWDNKFSPEGGSEARI